MNRKEFTKTLVVYLKGSYFKYYDIFVDNLYEIDSKNNLNIYERCHQTGKETLKAAFKSWDYFIIE
jgi:hypothetical protein